MSIRKRPITIFSDGSALEFDTGVLDDWCVYLTGPGKARIAPRDEDYFQQLVDLGNQHGAQTIYDAFVAVYAKTGKAIDGEVLAYIETASKAFGADALSINKLLCILYAGMLAEENKRHTKLGKRIKRLGMYQCLIEKRKVAIATSFSRGMKWQHVHRECILRGF
jgi:hypothetical protein